MDQALAALMRNIGEALRLDNDSHSKEAYVKYLDCILCITCNLLQVVRDSGGDVFVSKEIRKQVNLAQQCIERVSVIIDKIDSSQMATTTTAMHLQEKVVSPRLHIFVPPLPVQPTADTYTRPKGKTPMEVAYQQNKQLMTAYRARMGRMNKQSLGTASLSLTVQRKMAENVAIARKQETALAKKMQERQQRLEEQASKRFIVPMGMSKEEQEQRLIYKKILEYEQDAKWLQEWRTKLENKQQEPELFCQLIQEILRCTDHPLTLLLKKYQYRVYEKLYPLVCNKKQQLAAITVPLVESMWPVECGNEEMAHSSKNFSAASNVCRDSAENSCDGIELGKNEITLSLNEQASPTDVSSKDVESKIHSQTDEKSERTSSSEFHIDKDIEKMSTGNMGICAGLLNTLGRDEETRQSDNTEMAKMSDNCEAEPGHHLLDNKERESESDQNQNTLRKTKTIDKNEEAKTSDLDEMPSDEIPSTEDKIFDSDFAHQARYVEDIKDDISIAVDKGKKIQAKLTEEHKKMSRILSQVSKDYEKYNQENMDDLFDDEEEDYEDDETEGAKNTCEDGEEKSFPQDHLLQSVQSFNLESTISPSSSGASVEDFPPLPGCVSNSELKALSKEAYRRHLKNISSDVHMYMEKLLVMFTIAYEQLSSPLGRDQCYASLEETFFKPLWKYLLMLFRIVNYKDELTLAWKMTQNANAAPRDLGVTDKLCLGPVHVDDAVGRSTRPYQQAIDELTHIKEHYTMLSKLECIVKVMRLVCDCVKDYYVAQGFNGKIPNVGADDLLPVVNYVVLQSRLPQLVSECQAMCEFIHEGYIMGQEGYCLTTLETAISYILAARLNFPAHIPDKE